MIESLRYVLIEHFNNRNTIWQLSIAHAKKQTIRTSLGLGWVLIRDMVFFSAYIMFRFFMSGRGEMEGMHFILFLITGLVPWFFMNEVINGGSNAIKNNRAIITSVKFPITIVPTYEVFAIYIKRLFTFLIPFVVMLMVGDIRTFNIVLFLYYTLCMLCLMIFYNLLMSALIAVSEDFKQLYAALTRILFFLMPIMWSYEYIADMRWLQTILKLNPMVYILDGFRSAYVLGILPTFRYTGYFWGITVLMALVGCYTQFRMRRVYSDFI